MAATTAGRGTPWVSMISWESASGIGFIKGFGDWDFMRILGETSSGRRSPYRQKCAQDQAFHITSATQPRRRRDDVAPRSRRCRVDVLLTWRPASGGLPRLSDGVPRRSGGLPRSVGGLPPGRSAPPRLRRQGSSVWCVTSSPKGENFIAIVKNLVLPTG